MTERPRAIDAPPSGSYEEMLQVVEEMDSPVGYRAELIRGKIVVSPGPKPCYLRVMRSLRLQLGPHAPEGYGVDVAPFLFAFHGSGRAYGPDLHVADESAFEADGRHADASALSLVAELTSDSTKDVDWLDKMATYGQIVPVYLLLDMRIGEINVMWDPSPKGYRSRTNVPFGRPVRIPAPFDFALDTSEFVVEEYVDPEAEQR
ncbi:Uma2 family endonuclease [Streptomyces sp. NPDC005811]|uniref:Uma2 family endonuclease n=1 Tax=Streptomyces sp. NPDC005811 TaxID=3154565 RepID=UPI0033D1A96A